LVLNDSSHRAKAIGTEIDKGQKFSSKLWLCAVMAARLLGRVPSPVLGAGLFRRELIKQ